MESEDEIVSKKKFWTGLRALSENNKSNECIDEWDYEITITDDDDDHLKKCLCGHTIINLCYIRNRINNNVSMVGIDCINKFGNKKINDKIKEVSKSIRTARCQYCLEPINKTKKLMCMECKDFKQIKTLIKISSDKEYIDWVASKTRTTWDGIRYTELCGEGHRCFKFLERKNKNQKVIDDIKRLNDYYKNEDDNMTYYSFEGMDMNDVEYIEEV